MERKRSRDLQQQLEYAEEALQKEQMEAEAMAQLKQKEVQLHELAQQVSERSQARDGAPYCDICQKEGHDTEDCDDIF
jgi:hypothetical protein